MSVKKESSGRRSVQIEVVVPGTPEEVWKAIATGPGISCWFYPTDLEERVGGSILCHMGPGMDAEAKITEWIPPERLSAEGSWAPDAPPVATEWIVEAREGGRCLVRVVHSLFADTDAWDDQLEGTEYGWPRFFAVLGLYLANYRGQRCSILRTMGRVSGSESEAWDAVTRTLGLAGAAPGQPLRPAKTDMPSLTGSVEGVGKRHAVLRLESPGPGVGSLGVFAVGGQAHVSLDLYLYGNNGAAVVAGEEPKWQAWMADHYPMGG